jgi:hypothetical protein
MSQVNITGIQRRAPAWHDAKSAESLVFSQKDRDRFWAKVERNCAGGCWLWAASKLGSRYGQFVIQEAPGKQQHLYAHRVAWILARGPIPAGAYICHSCDVPLCVNPDHLFVGDQFDNMQDASQKGRLSIPRKRTRTIKPQVIERYLAGEATQRQLAAEYGVSHVTVNRWLKAHKLPYERPMRKAS